MRTRWDTVPVGGDAMRVYVAVPDGTGPFLGVAVMQGRGGVEETIHTLTRRLAEAGFAAAAPELYHRQKDNVLQRVEHLPPRRPRARIQGPEFDMENLGTNAVPRRAPKRFECSPTTPQK